MAETMNLAPVLDEEALAQLFTAARTHAAFDPTPLPATLLRRLYGLASMGPTSMNCQPGRFVFVTSEGARARLLPHLSEGNRPKVMAAPVTVIVARDTRFHEFMPQLWHVPEAREKFERDPAHARETAVRNTTLGGAYLLLAARALGLVCGPMSGFDAAGVNRTFFEDGRWEADFLINLGYPAVVTTRPRGHRLEFEQACVLA